MCCFNIRENQRDVFPVRRTFAFEGHEIASVNVNAVESSEFAEPCPDEAVGPPMVVRDAAVRRLRGEPGRHLPTPRLSPHRRR